jgi:hypothetical protein
MLHVMLQFNVCFVKIHQIFMKQQFSSGHAGQLFVKCSAVMAVANPALES